MKDYIVRAMAANQQLRVFAATTKNIVEQARQIHNTYPVATAALGRLLTAGAMMGSMMKGDRDILTLQIDCSGPIKGLTVTADSRANVKGYVKNPQVDLPPSQAGKLDVGKALDLGILNVIKDIGMKEPYNGQTHLVSGEIAEDLTYYFATSEQIPSSVSLGVLMNKDNTVAQAGGFIIQVMPFAEDAMLDKLEKKIESIQPVTSMLAAGMTPEDILEELLGEFGVEITDRIDTAYQCNCSRERVSKAISSIGTQDLQEMIDDGEPIEVKCHFCDTAYTFDADDLKGFLKSR